MEKAIDILKEVLTLESESIKEAISRLDTAECQKLEAFFKRLMENHGSLFFVGVGKSGHVGVKLASTFSSLGLRSFFLHPTEALHGDLGRVSSEDGVVIISYSGHSEEVTKFLSFCKIPQEMRVGLIGNLESPIAQKLGIIFDCHVSKEACLNNQAPTSSTTLAMAMGDALAVYFESLVGLSKEKFAINHPAGLLGKVLNLKVSDLMIPPKECPCLSEDSSIKDAIVEMTKFPVGACAVLSSKDQKILGIIVDGDFRRLLAKADVDLNLNVTHILNQSPVTISPETMAFEAMELMEKRERAIDILPVVDNQKFLGFVRLHDLLKEGFGERKK